MRKPSPASRDRLRDRIAPSASASPSAQCCSPASILLHPRSRTARHPSPSPSPFPSPSQNHLLSARGPCPTHRRPSRACQRSPTFDIRIHFVSRRRVKATDGLPDATPISSAFETSGPVVRIISSPCASSQPPPPQHDSDQLHHGIPLPRPVRAPAHLQPHTTSSQLDHEFHHFFIYHWFR
ncbi:hypothetical protein HETIRDRAFT_453673 [Heterobasidion irregulare TC 32-1]|uniref:Uncharacterized protein n=1 Tax=Heterobasidion irregulare (strain TC 32-1) TaxID=747525 RepID=W4K0D7_HETIT|nr:uncharacterized protein HETIRDRAFT_453673 [Heterobasidion irregulare TC 32-1]ETW79204.1 hypothetical protein HETIRDRAFT_453673 [Heterobasidion irregulare TC 32-1]